MSMFSNKIHSDAFNDYELIKKKNKKKIIKIFEKILKKHLKLSFHEFSYIL